MKQYMVSIDMMVSHDVFVKAKNTKNAKDKAWKKVENKLLNKKYYKIYVQEA